MTHRLELFSGRELSPLPPNTFVCLAVVMKAGTGHHIEVASYSAISLETRLTRIYYNEQKDYVLASNEKTLIENGWVFSEMRTYYGVIYANDQGKICSTIDTERNVGKLVKSVEYAVAIDDGSKNYVRDCMDELMAKVSEEVELEEEIVMLNEQQPTDNVGITRFLQNS